MSTDHRENVMKLIEHVREERREIVSDIVEKKGRRAVGQKEIPEFRKHSMSSASDTLSGMAPRANGSFRY